VSPNEVRKIFSQGRGSMKVNMNNTVSIMPRV